MNDDTDDDANDRLSITAMMMTGILVKVKRVDHGDRNGDEN